jgi:hypothetical protein
VPGSRTRLALVAVAIAVFALASPGCGGGGSSSSTGQHAATKSAPTGPPENVAFYYQRIRNEGDVSKLGKVQLVVAGRQNSASAVQAIHRSGAKAYRYVQTYWFPVGGSYDDLDIGQHRDWAYCKNGSRPLVGQTDGQGRAWWYLDMNERAVQEHFAALFQQLKAAGWDGVFFDRGQVALTGLEPQPAGIWDRTSTCTQQPVDPGATMSDAYVGMAGVAATSGLQLMINYGGSPFDTQTPMRPDPRDPACERGDWSQCRHLDDAWQHATWIADEAIAHPRDQQWENDYQANQQNEQNPQHRGQVVGLITTGTLGGEHSRVGVFFEWARVKLFAIPLAVGTGDSGCAKTAPGAVCNRQAAYPELAGLVLGKPLSNAPSSHECDAASQSRCVWTRQYANGMSVVNVRPEPANGLQLALGTSGCRYVRDVESGKALADNRCVTRVSVDLPAWSGRPLEYGSQPW